MSKAVYALSADPITYGHINVIERASKIFETLIIAIGNNENKKYLFTKEERVYMAKVSVSHLENVDIVPFDGLLVDFAHTNNIDVIIRGIRGTSDLQFEKNFFLVNDSQDLDIETMCLFTKPEYSKVSSSNVKAIQMENGLTSKYVPLVVKDQLEQRISKKQIFGITGLMGSGKSFIGRMLEEFSLDKNIKIHNIELDDIAKYILYTSQKPSHLKIREKVETRFNTLNKAKIANIIFQDTSELRFINELIYDDVLIEIRNNIKDMKGIILINTAILIESNMLDFVNNNVILVKAENDFRFSNLKTLRNIDKKEAERRIKNVLSYDEKVADINLSIEKNSYGQLINIQNNTNIRKDINIIYNKIINKFNS
jgi:pantetheine-phosphate adenylyltransferase